MYTKICPECDKKSYSASNDGEWNCPHCKQDLTEVEARVPNNIDNQRKEE